MFALAAVGILSMEHSIAFRRLGAPFDRAWRYMYNFDEVLL